MRRFIFILGGARSGKSAFAVGLARKAGGRVVYIATCKPQDDEMRRRVKAHRASRPRSWKTIEEPGDVKEALLALKGRFDVAIVDCLTLLVSNLLLDGVKPAAIKRRMEDLATGIGSLGRKVIVVSNEVGLGIVPQDRLSRDFRDVAGITNQIMARHADEAWLLAAGVPVKLK